MREILFRGKRVDNNEWTEGYLYKIWNKVFLLWGMTGDSPNMEEVIPETVGQYTGIKDDQDVKIFEGDIVSTDTKRPYLVVEFRDGCFMFNCNDGGEDQYDIMLPILKEPQTVYKYGEVIGNIHDNPELLEGGEEE